MTVQRLEHVGIVVDDLADAVEFFTTLGLELEGETTVEGDWADRIVGLQGNVEASLLPVPDPNWSIGAVVDLNGDGNPDIIWRNTATGQDVVIACPAFVTYSRGTLLMRPTL